MQINKEAEWEVVKKRLIKTQKDWIEYFNNKGEKMISAPDTYRVAKEENKALMESIKQDLKDFVLMTSTRLTYDKDTLEAEMIHDADSTVVKPKSYKLTIPVFRGEAKQDESTEKYLQALFDTKDDIATILKVLKRFDNERKVYLWTPSQSSRKDKQVRSVGLYFCDFDRFDVVGSVWFGDDVGFSRGVLIDSAKQTKKSKGVSK